MSTDHTGEAHGPIGGASPAGPAQDDLARAVLLLDLDRPEAALEAATRGLATAPQRPELHVVRALALLALTRLPEARQSAQAAVAAGPDLPGAHLTMGRVFLAERNLPWALYAFGQAAALDPHDLQARYLMVCCHTDLAQTQPADAVTATLLADAPDDPRAHVAAALVELTRVKRLVIRRPLLLVAAVVLSRGVALLALPVWWLVLQIRNRAPLHRADRALHEALRLAPDDPVVLSLTADVLARRGRHHAALDRTVRAARADAGSVDARALAGTLRRRQGLTELALSPIVAVLTLTAAVFGPVAGWTMLAVSAGSALALAGYHRIRLRRTLPTGLWRASVGRADVRWAGPALALVTASALALLLLRWPRA